MSGSAIAILVYQLNISRPRMEGKIMGGGVRISSGTGRQFNQEADINTVLVYTCQKAQPKRCDFFLWDDEAKGREAAALMNNSRTEPLSSQPSHPPQTPQKPPPYGLATPQTSTRFSNDESDVTTPHTPSKPSRVPNSSPLPWSATHPSTTQVSDSDE